MFQQMGFGVAMSLLIDATIIRSVLFPSAMALLGERNWYLPRWLDWLPHLEVEGHTAAESNTAAVNLRPMNALSLKTLLLVLAILLFIVGQ